MIEVENFNLRIMMKSGREYLFEVSRTELDWLFDGTSSISDSIYCVGNLRLFSRVYQVSFWLQGAKR
ncbi:TPA: hypothetical protein ACGOYK_000283 [Streptococcus suis]